jgi:hypothetical protein
MQRDCYYCRRVPHFSPLCCFCAASIRR